MKKGTLLNGSISQVIARLGHGDSICIGDAGLPIPAGVEFIDLAITQGIPPFIKTVEAVVAELCVERAIIATEFIEGGSLSYNELLQCFSNVDSTQEGNLTIEDCSHETFKEFTKECWAIIRTGECVPYANVILYAGVIF